MASNVVLVFKLSLFPPSDVKKGQRDRIWLYFWGLHLYVYTHTHTHTHTISTLLACFQIYKKKIRIPKVKGYRLSNYNDRYTHMTVVGILTISKVYEEIENCSVLW